MSTAVIPEPIAQLQYQLDQFRSTQPGRRRLPQSLWQAAVELGGGKVRIQWKAAAPPDWTSLLLAWRESEKR
jgi:hypothetical protein